MSTIFIQIASYRDPELYFTVEDCLKNAKYPENLKFCIAWQHDEKEEINKLFQNKQIDIIDIPYQESKGACWARSQTNKKYRDEKFTLQIDSHIRFIENWDEELINMWTSLNNEKAVLTTYPAEYYPGKPKDEWKHEPHVIHTHAFKNGYTQQRPRVEPSLKKRKYPYKAIHVAAGFIFGPGAMIKDVPYDPDLYFEGEETSLAIRLYTNGYDLFHPQKLILWHYYERKEQSKHWSDCKEWGKYHKIATERLECLLGRSNNCNLGQYGLGDVRTLEDFQKYSGIDYNRCVLHLDTAEGKEPPVDLTDPKKWSYEKKVFKQILKWEYEKLDKCEDPRFWALIIKDQNDHELYRKDLSYKEHHDVIDGKINQIELEFEYCHPAQIPSIFIIWPYSESKHWLNSQINNI
jgi:glycosyltransferase involved in cell wall biosynthesis